LGIGTFKVAVKALEGLKRRAPWRALRSVR